VSLSLSTLSSYHHHNSERISKRMEVGMSLNALIHPPLSSSSSRFNNDSLFSIPRQFPRTQRQHHHVLVVEAKGKKGMMSRQYQRPPPPPLPKVEDDGNPKFVVFIRMANVYLWYPLSIVSGGTTAKIMVAAKDNFLGKFIYKDTLDRNLAAVIYRVRLFSINFYNCSFR